MGNTPVLNLPYPELAVTADVPRDIQALATALDSMGMVPVGALMMWPTSAAPARWLLCLGQTDVPSSAWPLLVPVLGETSGFLNIPNLQGRVPCGPGAAVGDASSTAKALASAGGSQRVGLATTQLPAHNHPVTDGGHSHTASASSTGAADRSLGHSHSYSRMSAAGRGAPYGTQYDTPYKALYDTVYTGGEGAPDHLHGAPSVTVNPKATGISIQDAGGGATHENMPPYFVVNFIIRAG